MRQQFHRLADPARLVDAALLADRQVHRQMQERIGLAVVGRMHRRQGGVNIGQRAVVFGVLVDPQACYGFNSFQHLMGLGFGID